MKDRKSKFKTVPSLLVELLVFVGTVIRIYFSSNLIIYQSITNKDNKQQQVQEYTVNNSEIFKVFIMDENGSESINPFVVFEAKFDKDRGIVILTIRKDEKDDVCFFRFHHQPLSCHPEQLQEFIRSQNITNRTKSVKVNIYSYSAHYWNEEEECFEFKGVKLNSTAQQLAKIHSFKIKKEIGVMKRNEANANRAERKKADLRKLQEKKKEIEAKFQEERAKRIAEARANLKANQQ